MGRAFLVLVAVLFITTGRLGSAGNADHDDWGSRFYDDGSPRPDQPHRAGGSRGGREATSIGRRTHTGAPVPTHTLGHTDHGGGHYSYTAMAAPEPVHSNSTEAQRRLSGDASYNTTKVRTFFRLTRHSTPYHFYYYYHHYHDPCGYMCERLVTTRTGETNKPTRAPVCAPFLLDLVWRNLYDLQRSRLLMFSRLVHIHGRPELRIQGAE